MKRHFGSTLIQLIQHNYLKKQIDIFRAFRERSDGRASAAKQCSSSFQMVLRVQKNMAAGVVVMVMINEELCNQNWHMHWLGGDVFIIICSIGSIFVYQIELWYQEVVQVGEVSRFQSTAVKQNKTETNFNNKQWWQLQKNKKQKTFQINCTFNISNLTTIICTLRLNW